MDNWCLEGTELIMVQKSGPVMDGGLKKIKLWDQRLYLETASLLHHTSPKKVSYKTDDFQFLLFETSIVLENTLRFQ